MNKFRLGRAILALMLCAGLGFMIRIGISDFSHDTSYADGHEKEAIIGDRIPKRIDHNEDNREQIIIYQPVQDHPDQQIQIDFSTPAPFKIDIQEQSLDSPNIPIQYKPIQDISDQQIQIDITRPAPFKIDIQEQPVDNSNIPTQYPTLRNGSFIPNRRIVHLDLKGAPPKVHYFEKFFKLINRLGATGILIEWEDMFPFTGELLECRNGRAYSIDDVKNIFKWARMNRLEIIPLVQTFGHLEWILKHAKFAHLREVDRYPQTICPMNAEAIRIVKMAIDQVMALHQDDGGQFFHIGADEAFQVGLCNRCKNASAKFKSPGQKLMVNHIARIAEYVKHKYNRDVLIWHDMLVNVDAGIMKEANLGDLVEPVVWAYVENVGSYLNTDMWDKFSETFPYIWAASAFKGADGPNRYYSNVPHYLKNHISWANEMTRQYAAFQEFRGIFLTGWQRFDHFAILCELLPVGIPSLGVNLQVIMHGGDRRSEVIYNASMILGCENILAINSDGIAGTCDFPGYGIYQVVQELKLARDSVQDLFDSNSIKGWGTRFNFDHNYTQIWYLDEIAVQFHSAVLILQDLIRQLRFQFGKMYEEDTVDEFIAEHVHPDIQRLLDKLKEIKIISKNSVFPLRPFAINLKKNR